MSSLKQPALLFVAALLLVGSTAPACRGGATSESASECHGTPAKGSLSGAQQLPRTGSNFRAYSSLGWLLGRTYVHSAVHAVVLDAYQQLAQQQPSWRFVYGETGWADGGSFRPHRASERPLRGLHGACARPE